MSVFKVHDKFASWATALTGMDGGNPKASLWMCGIERGSENTKDDLKELRAEIEQFDNEKEYIPSFSADFRKDETYATKVMTSPFTRKTAKMVSGYLGKPDWREYIANEFCDPEGPLFKMNLYPLNFQDTNENNWKEVHYQLSGFPTKSLYKAWCIENRFPVLKSIMHEYSPKVLICVGGTFKTDYVLAFGDKAQDLFDGKWETESLGESNKKCAEYMFINQGKTALIITPFLGRGGLMSDDSLQRLGALARRLTAEV